MTNFFSIFFHEIDMTWGWGRREEGLIFPFRLPAPCARPVVFYDFGGKKNSGSSELLHQKSKQNKASAASDNI